MDELDGLRDLNRIGKSWFVIYKYYQLIDHSEACWKNCSTVQMRKSVYERTREYHTDWLKYIVRFCGDKLETNQLGKSGPEVIDMAKEILAKIK